MSLVTGHENLERYNSYAQHSYTHSRPRTSYSFDPSSELHTVQIQTALSRTSLLAVSGGCSRKIAPRVPSIALNSMVNQVPPWRSHGCQSDGIILQKFFRIAAEPACASTSEPNISCHGVIPCLYTHRGRHNPMPDQLGAQWLAHTALTFCRSSLIFTLCA